MGRRAWRWLISVIAFTVAVLARCASTEVPVDVARYAHPVRVACLGDSITAGVGVLTPEFQAYPAQLQRMLDPAVWRVRNFGVSGATLLTHGDKPYVGQPQWQDAIAFDPDVVVIVLGTNDTKPDVWRHAAEFESDYRALIATLRARTHVSRIFVCRPPRIAHLGNWGINEKNLAAELPHIDAVVAQAKVDGIDLHAAFTGREVLLPDNVHPNVEGANVIAAAVYRALVGREFTGPLDPFLHSEWQGYARVDFMLYGRWAFVVQPKQAATGRPWIWRPEFFGVEPQTELALLARGWHAGYVDVRNLYGGPLALDIMDEFYRIVVRELKLSPKVALAGFSRGGLFAFNWAARHPARVAAIYADAPVLDFKSWPGGKGAGKGSADDWRRCLEAYGLTESAALEYKLNPVDNLGPLAEAHIPILCVYGTADRTVPPEENVLRAKQRYAALGGEMVLIAKSGGDHHPHSLPDPAPIVDFLVRHAPAADSAAGANEALVGEKRPRM